MTTTTHFRLRLLLCAVAGGVLAGAAMVGFGVTAASATPQDLCQLLPALCPTTTVPKAPPTTHASLATTAPTPAPPATTHPAGSTATTKPAPRRVIPQPSVGAAGLAVPQGPAEMPSLGTTDPPAPLLAATAIPSITPTTDPSALSGLVGAAGESASGTRSANAALRIALSMLALVIAGLATAQLPESRRTPRSEDPAF
jgi:hypothetical protein